MLGSAPWVCSWTLKSIIEDLSFKGEGLFSITTDTVLQEMDKSLKASRTLGVSTSVQELQIQIMVQVMVHVSISKAVLRPSVEAETAAIA